MILGTGATGDVRRHVSSYLMLMNAAANALTRDPDPAGLLGGVVDGVEQHNDPFIARIAAGLGA